ncbi:hypothetical protein Tco_1499960 [Tanacetum coccineum]
MGRGTWYCSLGVSSVVDAFVRSEFEISSWHGARVGVRTYLLDGAIDGGEANGIIRDPNTRSNADLRRLVSFDVFGKARVVRSYKVRVGSNGNLLWEVSVLLGRKKGREDVREFPTTVEAEAKRKLSNNDLGSMLGKKKEKVMACTSRTTEAKESVKSDVALAWTTSVKEDGELFILVKQGSNLIWEMIVVQTLRYASSRSGGKDTLYDLLSSFTSVWGLAFEYGCASFEAWYGRNDRLWVVEGLTLERCSKFGKKDKLEPSYVGPFEIFGYIGPTVQLRISVL